VSTLYELVRGEGGGLPPRAAGPGARGQPWGRRLQLPWGSWRSVFLRRGLFFGAGLVPRTRALAVGGRAADGGAEQAGEAITGVEMRFKADHQARRPAPPLPPSY